MLGLYLLAIGLAAAESVTNHGPTAAFVKSPLKPRQTSDPNVIVPLVPCTGSASLVTACEAGDFTSDNWRIFDIDAYLITFIQNFGIVDDFPNFFVAEQSSTSNPDIQFDCFDFNSDETCIHAFIQNPAIATDCAFSNIPNVNETHCANYLAPEAAFIVQNYINYYHGLENHFNAVQDAGNAVLNGGFVDQVVSGLTPNKGSILDAVFELLAGLAVAILPVGGEIAAASEFVEAVGIVLKATGGDLVTGSSNIVQVVNANNAQAGADTSTAGLVKQQVQNIVTGTQALMQNLLTEVFGLANPQDLANGVATESAVIASNAFKFAQEGRWLDNVPARADLAAQMEVNLKNWIISRVMKSFQYDVLVDTIPLEGDINVQTEDCVQGRGGFLASNGCAQLRVNGIGADGKPANEDTSTATPQDASILNQVDFNAAIANAQACQGGLPDFSGFLAPGNTSPGLPSCFYDFGVLVGQNV